MKTLASGLMLATLVMADLPAVTITAAPQSVVSSQSSIELRPPANVTR